jgi:hypothetical protein
MKQTKWRVAPASLFLCEEFVFGGARCIDARSVLDDLQNRRGRNELPLTILLIFRTDDPQQARSSNEHLSPPIQVDQVVCHQQTTPVIGSLICDQLECC